MGDDQFDVVALQMDDRVKRLCGHVLVEQVDETVTREELLPVEIDCQSRVEEDVVFQEVFDILLLIVIILEDRVVGHEIDSCTVGLVGGLDSRFLLDDGPVIFDTLAFAVAVAGDLEIAAQGIHRLDTDTVQADRFLEGLAVVFRAGVHLARHVDDLTEWHATTIVAYLHRSRLDGDLNGSAIAHHVLVDGVVEYLFQ